MKNIFTIRDKDESVKRSRGDVGPDGLIFWQLNKNKKELWLSPEAYVAKVAAVKAYQAEYKEKNREKLNGYLSEYYQKNKGKLDAVNAKWSKDNADKASGFRKKWRKNNRKKLNEWRAARARERRKTDPIYALREVCRTRIRHAFDNKGMKRRSKIAATIGCTWELFKKHIEMQFQDGMTWDNRNLWELDHIIPLSSANTEEEIRKLSHFSNIQPLWREDNRKKSDKMPDNP